MTKEYADQHARTMRRIYGPFVPGSLARTIRTENEKLGLRTCWNCIRAYKSLTVVADGTRQRIGRGHFYCSRRCYAADHERRSLKKKSDRLIGPTKAAYGVA
jgi:hypothetical protein